MMTEFHRRFRFIACILALAPSAGALAGDVRLVSDALDLVCRVEITSGPDAPNGPVETFVDVRRDWSVTRSGKLCYRRASTPANCDSGMTQWNTPWRCGIREGDGTEQMSLR